MRMLLAALTMGFAALLLATDTEAQDKKKEVKTVVLKGLVACNKCELGKSDKCETVIVVKDAKKKETVYFFDAASHKKYHDGICTAAKPGSVTGTVKDVEKKKVISVTKVAYD